MLAALKMLLHIHTVVENSDDNDPGFRTGSVKDNMTALTELFVPWFYVTRIAANIRLASEQLEASSSCLRYVSRWRFPHFSVVKRPISTTSFRAEEVSRYGRISELRCPVL